MNIFGRNTSALERFYKDLFSVLGREPSPSKPSLQEGRLTLLIVPPGQDEGGVNLPSTPTPIRYQTTFLNKLVAQFGVVNFLEFMGATGSLVKSKAANIAVITTL